jgi:nucleoside-diphosphate-sugar epimerase
MGIPIPEGKFDMVYKGKLIEDVIFPRQPGSFYHASKVASTYYIDCACKWWGLNATDIMQGVVYGNWTSEIEKTGINSPLYSDEAFGTVVNRFIVQTIIGYPMTVYGTGDHSRGFLSLNDSVQCLMLAIKNPPEGYNTWNQLDTVYTMNQLVMDIGKAAESLGIEWDVTYIQSPRAEKTSWFEYNPVVDKLSDLGFSHTRELKEESIWVMNELLKVKDSLYPLDEGIIPKIMWK